MTDLRGTSVEIATESPQQQVVWRVRLAFADRTWYAGMRPTVRLILDSNPDLLAADLGPGEAREVARYLVALADSVEEARK